MGRRPNSGHVEPRCVVLNLTDRLYQAIAVQVSKDKERGLRGHYYGNVTAVIRRTLLEKFGNDPVAEQERKIDERLAAGVGPVPEREAVR